MNTTNNEPVNYHDPVEDISLDFTGFSSVKREAGGTWARGTIAEHRFTALVFAEHAESEAYELGESRISKLWIQRLHDNTTVLNFDRGWDVAAETPLAAQIAGFLCEGLAAMICD